MTAVFVYGLGAMLGTTLACSAVSLRSFLTVPLWVVFIPVVLAWAACGMRGFEPEGMMGAGGISLAGGPLLASRIVGLPLAPAERWAVGFSVIRNSLATTLVVLLPLCLMAMMLGAVLRGAMESGVLRLPRR